MSAPEAQRPHFWDPFEMVGIERVLEAEKRLTDHRDGLQPYAPWPRMDKSFRGFPPLEIVDRFLARQCPGDPLITSAAVRDAVEKGLVDWETLGVTAEQFSRITEQSAGAYHGSNEYFAALNADSRTSHGLS